MKCPECGSVSSSSFAHCEQCGHQFRFPADGETVFAVPGLDRQAADSHWDAPPSSTSDETENREALDAQDSASAVAREKALISGYGTALDRGVSSAPVNSTSPPQDDRDPAPREVRWRTELTKRVRKFRRRRANLRGPLDTESTLDLDFGQDSGVGTDTFPGPPPGEQLDVVLRACREPRENLPALDSIPLHQEAESGESHTPVDIDPDAYGLELERRRRRLDRGEISIVMESPPADELESAPRRVPVAPLGQRFLAGVGDGLLLLLALAFFVAIFWWLVGARVHLRPFYFGAFGFVVGFLVLTYFALFARLAPATPGQHAAGLRLRSLDGGIPTSEQVSWRAFGYLLSLSALMLGFVWALFDHEGLTWHDHMSGTFLAGRKSK